MCCFRFKKYKKKLIYHGKYFINLNSVRNFSYQFILNYLIFTLLSQRDLKYKKKIYVVRRVFDSIDKIDIDFFDYTVNFFFWRTGFLNFERSERELFFPDIILVFV